jgi:hypothetical protein
MNHESEKILEGLREPAWKSTPPGEEYHSLSGTMLKDLLDNRVILLSKQLAEKDKEIERLKALLLKQEDIFKVKNNLCRCCGAIMSDEEKCTHNCNKEPIIRN